MNSAPVDLRELTAANRDVVLAFSVLPEQQPFVGTVVGALTDAADHPQANPWYRAIYAGDEPVGFVMISWNCVPQPPEIIGPWFLWKLLIDHRHQGRGYGAETVRLVAELIGRAGARELLTSCFPTSRAARHRSTSGSASWRPAISTPPARPSFASGWVATTT